MDERVLAAKWAPADQQYAGRRACLDLAIRYSRVSKTLSPKQAGAFKAAACGALMTADRAQRLGYLTDGMCTLWNGALGNAGDARAPARARARGAPLPLRPHGL